MRLRFSFTYAIAFLLLTIVMMELHEQVHILTGWSICGCWGPRDFNVWELCDGCERAFPSIAWMATLAMAWLAWRVYGAETARWVLLLLPTTVGMIGFSHAAATDMP